MLDFEGILSEDIDIENKHHKVMAYFNRLEISDLYEIYTRIKEVYIYCNGNREKVTIGTYLLYFQSRIESSSYIRKMHKIPIMKKCHDDCGVAKVNTVLNKVLENYKINSIKLNIRYDVVTFKKLLIDTYIFHKIRSDYPINLKSLINKNNELFNAGINDGNSYYSNNEFSYIKHKLLNIHSNYFHYTDKPTASLVPPLKILDKLTFDEIASLVSTNNKLKDILPFLGISTFGGAYSEITMSNNYVYLGFDNLIDESAGGFHLSKPYKYVFTYNNLKSHLLYVTVFHRQAASLISSLNIDFFKEYPRHIELTINLWNTSIYSFDDYIDSMSKLISRIDYKKYFISNSAGLLEFLKNIHVNKYSYVDEYGFPLSPICAKTARINPYYQILIELINKLSSKNRLLPPICGDLLYSITINTGV